MTGSEWDSEEEARRDRTENGSRQAEGHEKSLLNCRKHKDKAVPDAWGDRDARSALDNSQCTCPLKKPFTSLYTK